MIPPEPDTTSVVTKASEKTKEKDEAPATITTNESASAKMGQEMACLGLAAVVNMPQVSTVIYITYFYFI